MVLGVTGTGCKGPPFNDVLVDSNGEQIRSPEIQRIFDNPDLTEEEQRQALRDLGITDESLIDLLVRLLGND
jgi:hypothetical protein